MKKIDLRERVRCDGGNNCPRMARKISAQENTIQVRGWGIHHTFECDILILVLDFLDGY